MSGVKLHVTSVQLI